MTGKFAAQAAAIQREQWEQYPDIMRYIYGSPPERAAPERSGTTRKQTGDKNAFTPRRKCGIIKAIKRYVRRKIKNYRRAKTMIIKIRLTQNAYINSGEYRLHTDSGKPSAYVLREWYEAAATDNSGKKYYVFWAIRDDWDANSGDESDACDWDNPAEIIRLDTGDNVTSRAKIEW